MTCIYKKEQIGTYPLGASSTIAQLATLDRSRIDAFVTSCRNGLVGHALVTKLDHLSLLCDVPKEESLPFCAGIADAFLLPCDNGLTQMSAQFDPIVLMRDNRAIVFRLECANKRRKDVSIPCEEVYKAFETACKQRKDYSVVIRNLLDATKSAHIQVKNTRLAGHKIWVRFDDEADFATLYVVRMNLRHRHKTKSQLAIVAADIRSKMLNEYDIVDSSDECVICFEELGDDDWECGRCHNRLHATCARAWKDQDSSCPFCRAHM